MARREIISVCLTSHSRSAPIIKDLVDKFLHKEILQQYILKRFTALEISRDICYSWISDPQR